MQRMKKNWKSSNNRTWSLLYFVWAQVFSQASVCEASHALCRWYALLSVIRTLIFFISDSDSVLPFHLIVYIRMLEFMFTSFDFSFFSSCFWKCHPFIVARVQSAQMKNVHSTLHFSSHCSRFLYSGTFLLAATA